MPKHCKSYKGVKPSENVVSVNGTFNFTYTRILFFTELFTHLLDRHLLRSFYVLIVLGTVLSTEDKR